MPQDKKESRLDAALPAERHVGKYVVEKLPLGAYFALIRRLEDVPQDLLASVAAAWQEIEPGKEAEENNRKIFDVILKVVARIPDEAAAFLANCLAVEEADGSRCRVTKDDLADDRDLGLDGFVELAVAVYEVNDLASVFDLVKKKLPERTRNYLQNLAKIGFTNSST